MTGKSNDLRSRRRDELVREVRRIALRQFGQQGYDATSLKGICEEAGISLRTLFRHFKNKDDILASRNAEWGRRIVQELTRVPLEVPLLEAYRTALFSAIMDDASSDREELRLMMRLLDEVPSMRGEYRGSVSGHSEDQMNAELARRLGVDVTDPRVRLFRSFLADAVMQAMADWANGMVPGELDELINFYLSTIQGVSDLISGQPSPVHQTGRPRVRRKLA